MAGTSLARVCIISLCEKKDIDDGAIENSKKIIQENDLSKVIDVRKSTGSILQDIILENE